MEVKICPSCKEQNNPSLSTCWKCHAALDQAQITWVNDDLKQAAMKGWDIAKRASKKTSILFGKALDKVGDFSKHVCVYNGMSAEEADKVSKTVKVATAVVATAIGCAAAAPVVVAALGSAAGAGAVSVTAGLAAAGDGSVAAGGAGMAGGIAAVAATSAVAAGAAGIAVQKREERIEKEPEKPERNS